jgi:uncharacterized damage-inducible protein DinB
MATVATAIQQTSAKEQFLEAYEKEHATTLKVLRAYPADQADLRPHPKCKTAKELAWIFVIERALGTVIMHDGMAKMTGTMPPPPERFEDVITALEKAHKDFADLIRSFSDQQLTENVTFFVAPRTPGPYQRIQFAWFLLFDQIHHRGQFSIYLRMADAKVPSIYGPTADEPWM